MCRKFFPGISGGVLTPLTPPPPLDPPLDIPVHHAQCVWHMSKVKVKVTENTKTTIWAITSEPEVVETSGWFQNVPCQHIYQKCRSPHDAWRSVFASHDVNSEPIDFKIGTHIDFTCTIYHIQNCTNKNNITRITMATKYPIIKHRAFFKTLISAYHPFILDGFLWNFAYEISLK